MKKLFLILCLFFPLSSRPAPQDRIGDYIKYKIWDSGKISYKKSEVLQFDFLTHSFLVREIDTDDGGFFKIEDDWVPEKLISTPAQGQKIISECEQNSGKLESFLIDDQSFTVCRKNSYKESIYDLLGIFPLEGRAKLVNFEDVNLIADLIAFHWAHPENF